MIRALLSCYPRAWRTRYGDEYAVLLADLLAEASPMRRPALVVDILRGAFDARIHPGGPRMFFRTPVTAAIWAAGLFTVAGLGFQKMNEDVGIAGHPGIAVAFVTLICAATIALGALVVAALPALAAMVRGRSVGAWPYLAVPIAGVAAWLAVVIVAQRIAGGHAVGSAPTVVGAVLIVGSGLLVVAATAWAASTVLQRVDAPGPARLRPATLSVIAGGMAVTTVACLGWGAAVLATRQSDAAGLLTTPFLPTWITIIAVMAIATVIASTAARRQVA
jgi:hypothetical protein